MKIVKWVGISLVAVIAIVFIVIIFWGGHVIKQGVNQVGPRVLGVPVQLEEARFYPLRGHISMNGLVVSNPEGFRTESLFDMELLSIDIDVGSLFTDTIIIDRIEIASPQITYERGLRRSNIDALVAGLEQAGEEVEPDEEEVPVEVDEVDTAKTVIIRELILADARAQVSVTALRGRVVPIQLSTITLTELGGEDQSITQITTQVMKAILGSVVNAISGAGELLGDGMKAALGGVGAAGEAAMDGAKKAGGAAADGAKAVGGAAADGAKAVGGAATDGAKKVGGAAADGAKAVGGAAADGAKNVGGAAADGAKAVSGKVGEGLRSIGGMLGGKTDEEEPDDVESEEAVPAEEGE